MLSILVPTDYSPEAKNALHYAYHFAIYTNSSLVLYHVIPAIIPVSEMPFENYYLDEAEEQHMLLDTYENTIKEIGQDPSKVKVSAKVDSQNEINFGIEQAFKNNNCDLVIMGTHGASGFRKVFWGSNTAKLISQADFPVMAIPGNYKFEPIYHLIYASDLKKLEEELEVLVPFANVFQAVLEIFYFDYAGPESEKLMLEAEKYLRAHPYKNLTLNIKKGNLQLNLAENLKRQINYGNTQLLIMYRGSHTWLENLLIGSSSQRMVLDSGLPVLVMHKSS
ncbi:MAG: universal stress protein [Bacteroidota bacterium]|nr:universal stress protein [Bacteroidota bacterium]